MAAKKYYNTNRTDGNTVRKMHYVMDNAERSEEYSSIPVRQPRVPAPDRRQNEKARRRNRAAARRYERTQGINFFSFLVLLTAVAAVLYVCVGYLQIHSNIQNMSKMIADYESNISQLKNDNDAALNRISTSVDLEHIYDVAVNELGMVYSNNNRVYTYESIKSDYIRKYGDIPEAKDKGLIDKILN